MAESPEQRPSRRAKRAASRSPRAWIVLLDRSPWFEVRIGDLQRQLSGVRAHSAHAQQVVGRAGQPHQLGITLDAVQAGLAQTANGFAPAKELLNTLAHDLAGSIGRRAQRALIQPDGAAALDAGDVRPDMLGFQGAHELPRRAAARSG